MTTSSEQGGAATRPEPYRLGERVRVVGAERLEAALYDPAAVRRPSPAQFRAAGRPARIVGVLLDGAGPLHRLAGLPDLWPTEWLEPADR